MTVRVLRPLPVTDEPVPVLRPAPVRHTHRPVLPGALDLEKIIDRFVSRETNGCLVWRGKVNNRGLLLVTVGPTSRAVHRLQYTRQFGPIPVGKAIGWTCGNRLCLEPSHLVPKDKDFGTL
jgi:hypothetical protein